MMDWSDLFLSEVAKLKSDRSDGRVRAVEEIGKRMAEQYKRNLETLATITADYIRHYHRADGCRHCNPAKAFEAA